MKKIGIITMYHNSLNYGGVLQAFALQKVISNMGYECKQISYIKEKNNKKELLNNKIKTNKLSIVVKLIFFKIIKKVEDIVVFKFLKKEIKEKIKNKYKKFDIYRKNIPHTEICDKISIKKIEKEFDIFICGSDQIWKPGVICNDYLLGFVEKNKKKISYAASISKSNISEKEIEYMLPYLKDFTAISIRENRDIDVLEKKLNKKVKWVLDPTMLLSEDEWLKNCSDINIKDKYVFCYILGMNRRIINSINNFSKNLNYKIVTIPYASGRYNILEKNFGHMKIYDADPNDFLSLIKNSELVITDSFHATVFSIIFKKNFFVLEREEETTMNPRIISLLKLVHLEDRFMEQTKLLNLNIKDFFIKYDNLNELENMKKESYNFLKKALGVN